MQKYNYFNFLFFMVYQNIMHCQLKLFIFIKQTSRFQNIISVSIYIPLNCQFVTKYDWKFATKYENV